MHKNNCISLWSVPLLFFNRVNFLMLTYFTALKSTYVIKTVLNLFFKYIVALKSLE